ncbi:putative phage tail protein [Cytobacillus sp. Hm23]
MEYLPSYYKDIREFNELTEAESVQFVKLEETIEDIINDQFILTSSEKGIERREAMFKIIPDKSVETLDFRKKRLLNRMRSNPPYVLQYLQDLLVELLGEDQHKIELDVINYHLETLVKADRASFYHEVSILLEKIVPLNLDISTTVVLISEYMALLGESYTFPINYRVTNRFTTASVPGAKIDISLKLIDNAYSFEVNYPVCGRFRAGGA